jgi:hypothetical protein
VSKDVLVHLLSKHGPSLSSQLARQLAKTGMSAATARKRVSRLGAGVKRLAYLPFPRNARFLYLEKDFGSPRYWDALITALLDTNSAYGLALAALRQRGGIMPLKHFPIACGAPLRQKKHLAPETIAERLKKAQLIGEYSVAGVGPCIALLQGPDRFDDSKADIRARLLVERLLLKAISDWLKHMGIVSFERVALRDAAAGPPKVGTFAWDLSGPSYLGAMVRRTADGQSNPGFVACDVLSGFQVNEEGLRPFLHKCITLRTLKRVGPCLQIFVADHFAPDAFARAKRSGVIPATPANMFGKDVGEAFIKLFEILSTATQFSIDPDSFNFVFEKLSKIEGAALNLRGALFEYLVAEIVRRQSNSPFVRIAKTYKMPDSQKIEVDVVSEVANVSVTFIECKGYHPAGTVSDQDVSNWLEVKIPKLYAYARSHPDWKSLKIMFEFWTTGNLTNEASSAIDYTSRRVRPTKYTVVARNSAGVREMAKLVNDSALLKVFNEHFFEHPLASAERKSKRLYVPRPRSLANTAATEERLFAQQLNDEFVALPDTVNSLLE